MAIVDGHRVSSWNQMSNPTANHAASSARRPTRLSASRRKRPATVTSKKIVMSLYPGVCARTLDTPNAPATSRRADDDPVRAPEARADQRRSRLQEAPREERVRGEQPDDLGDAQQPVVPHEREHRAEQQLELGARPEERAGVLRREDVVALVGEVQATFHRREDDDDADHHHCGDDDPRDQREPVGDRRGGVLRVRSVGRVRCCRHRRPLAHGADPMAHRLRAIVYHRVADDGHALGETASGGARRPAVHAQVLATTRRSIFPRSVAASRSPKPAKRRGSGRSVRDPRRTRSRTSSPPATATRRSG